MMRLELHGIAFASLHTSFSCLFMVILMACQGNDSLDRRLALDPMADSILSEHIEILKEAGRSDAVHPNMSRDVAYSASFMADLTGLRSTSKADYFGCGWMSLGQKNEDVAMWLEWCRNNRSRLRWDPEKQVIEFDSSVYMH